MKRLFLILLMACVSCSEKTENPLMLVLQSEHPSISKVMDNLENHEVQILYTEIERDANGSIHFIDHSFQVNAKNYFYPASTVKLPAAVLALEWADADTLVTPHTTYSIARDSLSHSIADDVRQIFAVSDNEAYNRLYELLGRNYMNQKLRAKNITPIRLAHRLSTSEASEAKRLPLHFEGITLKRNDTLDTALKALHLNADLKGEGFIRSDSLIKEPMDFTQKNYFPLESQHNLIKRIFFPEYFNESSRFSLSTKSLEFLKEQMHTLPRNNGYDESEYFDGYGKFFLYGDTKDRIPDHIKVYNKVGYAYGTLTDTAYIVDEASGIEFLLSATILVNENGIFNDNIYEYDSIGMPFLAQLGRGIYEYEKAK